MIMDNINIVNEKLKNSIEDMYSNTISYNEIMYNTLRSRINREIYNKDMLYIYTSAEEISKIDPLDEFLSPINPLDLESSNYNLAEINYNIKNGQSFTLTTIFMECDFLTFNRIINNKNSYKGEVLTDIKSYEINFYVNHSMKYMNEIERLYRIFQNNGVKWRTVNCPFAYKYIDLVIKEELNIEGNIQEIVINLGEYESYKKPNVIPLWNISKFTTSNSSNYMPTIDRLIFEHEMHLNDSINGYLLASHSNDYLYHRRQENEFIMVTSKDIENGFDVLRINNPSNLRNASYAYEVVSNRSSSTQKHIIRTKSELYNFINSYKILNLYSVKILDDYKNSEKSKNLNKFLDNNIRSDLHKKIMLLTFEGDIKNFLIYDKINFLVSEVQLFFLEYRVVGEII